jgi:hypothetical protein
VRTGQRAQLEFGDNGLDRRDLPALVADRVAGVGQRGIKDRAAVVALGGRDGKDLLDTLVIGWKERAMVPRMPRLTAALTTTLDLGWAWWCTGRVGGRRLGGVAGMLVESRTELRIFGFQSGNTCLKERNAL